MEEQLSEPGRKFHAFLSHASQNSEFAGRLVRSLAGEHLNIWFDDSDLKFGALLRNELQIAIRDSGALVLLWSEAAYRSRWVMAEIFMAFHQDRFIIPCVLDATPLPQFLQRAAYLDPRRDEAQIAEKLRRAILAAPARSNEIVVLPAGDSALVSSFINVIGPAQYEVLAKLETDFQKVADANANLDSALESVKRLAPLNRDVLNLAGYQCKNNYIVKHWDAIRQWHFPKDDLLGQGERYFFDTLCSNPLDASAVNGLGSILFYELELDAAEFFQSRAIELMRRAGQNYEAAEHDLAMIRQLKTFQAAAQPA